MSEPPRYKVIVLGNVGVGKTCLSNAKCRMPFRQDVRPSVGVLKMKTVAKVRGEDVHLEIWDTAGQEQYLSLVPMYLRGAGVCILVASLTDESSIPGMDRWLEQVRAFDPTIPVVVGINKTDQVEDPAVVDGTRARLAEKFPDLYFCSAKRGDGIEELFSSAAEKCLGSRRPAIQAVESNPNIPEQAQSSGCC
jgi:small GTP-binding protein